MIESRYILTLKRPASTYEEEFYYTMTYSQTEFDHPDGTFTAFWGKHSYKFQNYKSYPIAKWNSVLNKQKKRGYDSFFDIILSENRVYSYIHAVKRDRTITPLIIDLSTWRTHGHSPAKVDLKLDYQNTNRISLQGTMIVHGVIVNNWVYPKNLKLLSDDINGFQSQLKYPKLYEAYKKLHNS